MRAAAGGAASRQLRGGGGDAAESGCGARHAAASRSALGSEPTSARRGAAHAAALACVQPVTACAGGVSQDCVSGIASAGEPPPVGLPLSDGGAAAVRVQVRLQRRERASGAASA